MRVKKSKNRPFRAFAQIKKTCRFCKDNIKYIDYKDVRTLERLISDRGKIVSRRISGNCAKHQRLVAGTIKRSRSLALLAYSKVRSR